jgi:hypothetical protein
MGSIAREDRCFRFIEAFPEIENLEYDENYETVFLGSGREAVFEPEFFEVGDVVATVQRLAPGLEEPEILARLRKAKLD